MKFLANPKENSNGRKDGSLGQPLLLIIGLLYMSIMPLGLDFNHFATRGEMVRLDFHELDGHEPFMKSLHLDTSSPMTPCAVLRFSPWFSNSETTPPVVLRLKLPKTLQAAQQLCKASDVDACPPCPQPGGPPSARNALPP